MHIKALMVSDGMPTLWVTLNPSDLRRPLVLSLGVDLGTDTDITSNSIAGDSSGVKRR